MSNATQAETSTGLSSLIVRWRAAKADAEDQNKAYLKAVNHVRDLEGLIVEQLAMEGYDSVKHDGETIYKLTVRSVVKADGVSSDDLADVIADSDFKYLLKSTYNAQSLKGAVLERVDAGESLPDGLEGLIKITEYTKVGCRRS